MSDEIMRLVGLGMADGQIEQADRLLVVARKGGKLVGDFKTRDPLVVALEHLRSACGWLRSSAEAMSSARERRS